MLLKDTRSSAQPSAVLMDEKEDGTKIVRMAGNVREEQEDGQTLYVYDEALFELEPEREETVEDIVADFVREFGPEVAPDATHLDLGAAIRATLVHEGVRPDAIDDSLPSTASCTDRFYSYRAEEGTCGRHGAIAVLASGSNEEVSTDER